MSKFSARRSAYAETLSGFRAGDRVRLCPFACDLFRNRPGRKSEADRGTIVKMMTSRTARVRWDRFKSVQSIAAEFLLAAEDAASSPNQTAHQGDET